MWSEARKSYRSPEKTTALPQPFSSSRHFTPFRPERPSQGQSRQCPLHFNEPTHICLTCRKSICLRCALTYCQAHVIRTQADALPELQDELARLELRPKLQEISHKLGQSQERQEYLEKKALKLIAGIQNHFDYIADMLTKKKLQIIQYYDSEFQGYLQEHRSYDQELKERAEWIRQLTDQEEFQRLATIEEMEDISAQLRRAGLDEAKAEKRLTKIVMGKDKIKIEKMWNEEHLEKLLFEIEHIAYKLEGGRPEKKKKRVTTENATECHNRTIGFAKSSSNSRLPSGRKHVTPFS